MKDGHSYLACNLSFFICHCSFVIVHLSFAKGTPRLSGKKLKIVVAHFCGSEGRSSTRLGNARGSISSSWTTTFATSSGQSFQVSDGGCSPLSPKSVFTEPGIT